MKYVIVFISLFFTCGGSEINNDDYVILDSVISKSNKNLNIINEANKKSDSLVSGKIEQAANKINDLENQVKQLKQENNELKTQISNMDDDGKPFDFRTISDN